MLWLLNLLLLFLLGLLHHWLDDGLWHRLLDHCWLNDCLLGRFHGGFLWLDDLGLDLHGWGLWSRSLDVDGHLAGSLSHGPSRTSSESSSNLFEWVIVDASLGLALTAEIIIWALGAFVPHADDPIVAVVAQCLVDDALGILDLDKGVYSIGVWGMLALLTEIKVGADIALESVANNSLLATIAEGSVSLAAILHGLGEISTEAWSNGMALSEGAMRVLISSEISSSRRASSVISKEYGHVNGLSKALDGR